MSSLCREHDWRSTPLGPPSEWPSSLRTTVSTLLASRYPMFLFWGEDLIQFYNDAYRQSLGSDRHPSALGARGREFWADIWCEIGPHVERVRSGGEATWQEDQLIPIHRDGGVEEVYWTYSHSAVRGADGTIEGVLVVCQETTINVRTRQEVGRRLEDQEWFRRVFEGAAAGIAVASADRKLEYLNPAFAQIVGYTREELHAMDFLLLTHPDDRPGNRKLFGELVRGERDRFVIEKRYLRKDGGTAWVRLSASALHSEDGSPPRAVSVLEDITARREAEERFRESERSFRLLAESMPLIVWSADPEGRIDYQTQAVLTYTGRTREAFEGSGWMEVLHPEDRERVADVWKRSVRTGEPYHVEFRIRRHDGAYRWHLTRAVPVRNEQGEVVKWYGSSTDVHDHLQTESEARILAERLTTTLESITDAFYLLDREWRFAFLNKEAERTIERSASELLGEVLWDQFPEASGTQLEDEYRRAVENEDTASFRYFYPPLDRWFDIRAYPSSEGLGVYFRDVTDLREAELRLREQAELLDRARDAILVRELDDTIVYWNEGAHRMYGWSRAEVQAQSTSRLLQEDPELTERARRAVLETGEWSGEMEHRRQDSSTIIVESRWSLVRDEEGAPHRILAISTDITERKRLLAQFLRAQRMESIGTLAGGIAHDLNNVLSPVLLSIGMLKEGTTDREMLEILDTVESSAERGANMVRQVLAFARGVEGARVSVDLLRILDDLGRVIRDTFPKNITLRSRFPDDLRPLVGDPTQIHQVFMNLFVNARDAMPSGGKLAVSAENVDLDEHYAAMSTDASPGPHVMVSVSDSGVGMAPDIVERIFDPFFTTKEVGHGTGLGLSTVAAIVRGHGGFLNVYSEPGEGTTFRLYFPAGSAGEGARHGGEEADLPSGDGELVLVVDDERAVREITKRTLEAFGYRVLTATDGADAVATYGQRGHEIDLVLTDIMMPIMDGPAAIKALVQMDPEVKIVAASGLGANGGVAQAADSGVRHFLPKPYTAETLLTLIPRVLGKDEA